MQNPIDIFFPSRLMVLDGIGIYGSVLHYSLIIAFVGSAFLIFLYLWRKGRLDMDETPKEIMMRDDEREAFEQKITDGRSPHGKK